MKRRLIVIAAVCFAALDALFDMGPEKVIDEIRHERAAQDRQWGGLSHALATFFDVVEFVFEGTGDPTPKP